MSRFIDLAGKKIGKWSVLKRVKDGGRRTKFLCLCDCGTERLVDATWLRSSKNPSCGCGAHETRIKNELGSLVGIRVGRLTVLRRTSEHSNSNVLWECLCDCGNVILVSRFRLTGKTPTNSCGCYKRELHTKHGDYAINKGKKTKEYLTWDGMLQRCYNENNVGYKWYGKKGIGVCVEWHEYSNFLRDMGRCPNEPGRWSIERIDGDKDYSPNNCRWATQKEQMRNTSRNVFVNGPEGKTVLMDLSIETGINYGTLQGRYRRGDRGERLVRPVLPYRRVYKKKGSR